MEGKILAIEYIKIMDLQYTGSEIVDKYCEKDEDGKCHFYTVVEFEDTPVMKPVGCVALVEYNDKVTMSYSVCSTGDQFSYKMAREVALNRGIEKIKNKKVSLTLTNEEIEKFHAYDCRKEVATAISDLVYDYNMSNY